MSEIQKRKNSGHRVIYAHHHIHFGWTWTLRRTQLQFLYLIHRDYVKAVEDMLLTGIPDETVQALCENVPKELVDQGIIVACSDSDVNGISDARKHLRHWKRADEAWRDTDDSPLHAWMDEADCRYPLPRFLQ
jgi:hypothetical protein